MSSYLLVTRIANIFAHEKTWKKNQEQQNRFEKRMRKLELALSSHPSLKNLQILESSDHDFTKSFLIEGTYEAFDWYDNSLGTVGFVLRVEVVADLTQSKNFRFRVLDKVEGKVKSFWGDGEIQDYNETIEDDITEAFHELLNTKVNYDFDLV